MIWKLVTLVSFLLIGNGIAMSAYERMVKKETPQQQGLYGPQDYVTVLNSVNFRDSIYQRPIATFCEFYNSYCGACQRFSATWKEVAKNVSSWKSSQVAAIDCSTDENNDICREYEIMRYPTMRYFPPGYSTGPKKIGTNLDHLLMPQVNELIDELTGHLQNETHGGPDWPNFQKFDGAEYKQLFDDAPLDVKYIYVVSDLIPGLLASQIILDHVKIPYIQIRIIDSVKKESDFQLAVIDHSGHLEKLPVTENTRENFEQAIKLHCKNHNLAIQQTEVLDRVSGENTTDSIDFQQDLFYYNKARDMHPMPLFRSDLEQAIRFSLDHEIPQHSTIAGEALMALRHFVSVLQRYYKFGNQNSYRKLLDYVMEPSKTEVNGKDFQDFIRKLNPPVVSHGRYVGCYSTQPGLRRFPCSLWSLFHHLTVQELDDERADDPMEVLQAMHGYVKHFFGCTECSKHFQAMAARNRIWNITSKDQAVLWLWSAHNEVNQRLSGDLTEDKNHLKVQFPTEDHCRVCHKKTGEWDKNEILEFLRRHYGNDHTSDLGMDMELLPQAKMFNARARQIFQGAGDVHLHIGILAYVVIIICLMTIAVRFYFRRGYRKKLYTHDLLGKV